MNRSILFGGICALAMACSPQKEENSLHSFKLTNSSDLELQSKPVRLSWEELPGEKDPSKFPLILTEAGDTIPAQKGDLDGDGEWEEVFFVIDLPAQSERNLQLVWTEEEIVFEPKTSVRFGKRLGAKLPVHAMLGDTLHPDGLPKSVGYQPYQTDGPSWENDKVGFRHYFDGRNAKDLFGKKTSKMSPDSVGINRIGGVEDNYHVMEDWGRDILAVGNSAGLGGIALMIEGQPARLGVTAADSINTIEESIFRIVQEGPVKSVLQFDYKNWQTHGRSYEVQEKTSIWPGMYAYKNSVSVTGLQGDETLLVGLVNINNDQEISELDINDEWVVLLTHDQQSYNKEWWLGMALILPKSIYQGYTEAPETGPLSSTYLAKLSIKEGESVEYFAAAGWELSDKQFTDRDYFTKYISNLVLQISAEVEVTWDHNAQ